MGVSVLDPRSGRESFLSVGNVIQEFEVCFTSFQQLLHPQSLPARAPDGWALVLRQLEPFCLGLTKELGWREHAL